MGIRFHCRELLSRERGLTFDDVLIVPSKSDVRSRRTPQLKTNLTKKTSLEIPYIFSQHGHSYRKRNGDRHGEIGWFGNLHRFMPIESQVAEVRKVIESGLKHVAASVGVMTILKRGPKLLYKRGQKF